MTDDEAIAVIESAFEMIAGEWGEGEGSEEAALRHLLARLSAVEAERDALERGCAMQDELRQVAEARVEELEAELTRYKREVET